jgi:hypothetical protein
MSTIRADNFGNRAGTSSISADTLLQGTAKAWGYLNGTGTIALSDNFNFSSVTDNGVGDYTYSFSVARPSNAYSYMTIAFVGGGFCLQGAVNYSPLVSSVRPGIIASWSGAGGGSAAATDCFVNNVVAGDP